MSSLRPIHFLLLILSLLAISALSLPSERLLSHEDVEQFQELLADVADTDIHEVLHDWSNRFKDGVFHRDRTAMEAVHSENAAIATELVKLAKSKRSVSNTTTSTSTSSVGHSTPPPLKTTTTTNTKIRTSVIPLTSTISVSVISSSNGGVTTEQSSTALVEVTPSSTTLLLTTTLPDGSHSTITSTAVVNAAYTTLSTDTAVAAQSGTATGTPSLQTGGVGSSREYLPGALGVLAGAFAVALAQ